MKKELLESMTRKQIEGWLEKNNMKVCRNKAYKLKKAEYIAAIMDEIEDGKLFDPYKVYAFSKEKYLEKIEKTSGIELRKNVEQDEEIMKALDHIDKKIVKQNTWCRNTAYVDDKEYQTFFTNVCEVLDVDIENIVDGCLEHIEGSIEYNYSEENYCLFNTEIIDAAIEDTELFAELKEKNIDEYYKESSIVYRIILDRIEEQMELKGYEMWEEDIFPCCEGCFKSLAPEQVAFVK